MFFRLSPVRLNPVCLTLLDLLASCFTSPFPHSLTCAFWDCLPNTLPILKFLSQGLILGEFHLRYITTSVVQPPLDPIHLIDPTVFPWSLTASFHDLISFPAQFRFRRP